jgi:hypothetical protein
MRQWYQNPFQIFLSLFGPLAMVDTDTGSWTSLFCAASSEMKSAQSGTYFQRVADAGWQSSNAKDVTLAEDLEKWTKKKVQYGGWL